jgi:hypothetical protein
MLIDTRVVGETLELDDDGHGPARSRSASDAWRSGGWEPRRSADQPSVVIAAVEPEDGRTLSATVDDDTG